MLIELEPDNFPDVLPLYRTAGHTFPLISAVIQRKQRGQIFVDRREHPRTALVVNNFGFMHLLGAESEAAPAELLAAEGVFRSSYLLWYAPPTSWQERLDALPPERVRRRERVRFVFRPEQALYLGETAQPPAGFELRHMDADLLARAAKFGLHLDSRFWSSASDFLEQGLGVCLLKDGEVVSLCYAAAVVDGLAEVDVVTEPEYRGQGLGTLTAQQFNRECLSRELAPTWDCFVNNLGSLRLAESLGFAQVHKYPFYTFNVPLDVA